ncbi:hypothetical protein H2198_005496 [Neophaeococcomyces mojaviensis]|uniref:Uncharacterized protein n=1 Tax=Neophaeococcomyces mojaviensis TaxID=3383035 RepID=A0ACC3A5X8_9EURO|nr:hypothetical protein H2198_005496 [Knufia sp. JES_112]
MQPLPRDSKALTENAIFIMKTDITSRLAGTKSLFDKLDTSQWDLNDLRIYENLIEERRQIEMNHHRLAVSDVAVRPGQRKMTTADLKDSAGAKFKYDAEYASYRYTGGDTCVLDDAESCCHEVCRRAVNEGLIYLEYDTVMHYDQRIAAAKTARMKDALRKQRNIQLVKDLKDDEEWKQKCTKKIGCFGKEASEAIVVAASQILGWTSPQVKIELEPDTTPEQVGRALSKIRLGLLSPEKNTFGETFIRRLIPSKYVGLSWKNPAQYLEYLGPIQVCHLEAAILNIRQTLELSAMLYYETHFCLQRFLNDLRSLARQNVLPNRRYRAGLTVAELLHNIKASLSQDNGTMSKSEAYTVPLLKVLMACVRIESHARSEMWKTQEDCARNFYDPNQKLTEIKLKALDQSPMPSISKLALDRLEGINKEYCALGSLLTKARAGLSVDDLADAALAHVQKLADDETAKLGSTCRSLSAALEALRKRDEPNTKTMQPYDQLAKALLQTETETICLESRHNKDFLQKAEEIEKHMKPMLTCLFEGDMSYHFLPGMRNEESQLLLTEYLRVAVQEANRETFKNGWNNIVAHNIYRGVGEAFYVFRCIKKDVIFHADSVILQSLLDHSDEAVDLLTQSGNDIPEFLCEHYRAQWCLSSTFVKLLATLPHLSALNPNSARRALQTLSHLVHGPMNCIPEEWRSDLQSLSRVFLDTYGYLALESIHSFGRADVEQVVLTLLFILGFHTLIVGDVKKANSNLEYIKCFMTVVLRLPGSNQRTPWMPQVIQSLSKLINTAGLCCMSSGSCMKHKAVMRDKSATRKIQRLASFEPKSIKPKNTLKTEMYSNKASGQPTVESKLRLHKQILAGFIPNGSAQCPPLDRGKILKYCVYRIKLMGYFDEPLPGKKQPKQVDTELVNLLWQAFLYAEHVKCMAEPSSLNIGMHNHCSVWELTDSKEKACGFVEGYRRQHRDDKDLQILAQSFSRYAILNGKRDVISAFGQKWERLRELASGLPMRLEIFLSDTQRDLTESLFHDKTRLRAAYSRMDYTYSLDPDFPHPDKRCFLDLLELNTRRFEGYAAALVEETEISEGKDAAARVLETAKELVRLEKNDQPIEFDNLNLATLLMAAQASWLRSPHEDIIFSEDDDEYDEFDTMYDTIGEGDQFMVTKSDAERIDDDDDDRDSDTVRTVRAEDASRILPDSIVQTTPDHEVVEQPMFTDRDRPFVSEQATQTCRRLVGDQSGDTNDLAQMIDERGIITAPNIQLNPRVVSAPEIVPASGMPARTADIAGVQNLSNDGGLTMEVEKPTKSSARLLKLDRHIATVADIPPTVDQMPIEVDVAATTTPSEARIQRRKLIPGSIMSSSRSLIDEARMLALQNEKEHAFDTSHTTMPALLDEVTLAFTDRLNTDPDPFGISAVFRAPANWLSRKAFNAATFHQRPVQGVSSLLATASAQPFTNSKPVIKPPPLEPSPRRGAQLSQELTYHKAEEKGLEVENVDLKAEPEYGANLEKTLKHTGETETKAAHDSEDWDTSLSIHESTPGDEVVPSPLFSIVRSKLTQEDLAKMIASNVAEAGGTTNVGKPRGKTTTRARKHIFTLGNKEYDATARHTVTHDNDNSSHPSKPGNPPPPILDPAGSDADLVKESTSPTLDLKSPMTDTSFQTAQTSQAQEPKRTTSPRSAVRSFRDQLLALRSSMSSIQTILAPTTTTNSDDLHRFPSFERISQKAQLAALQCEYMLKAMTDERIVGKVVKDRSVGGKQVED